MKLSEILLRGDLAKLRAKIQDHLAKLRELGSETPDNPTIEDYEKEAFRLAQQAKEFMNLEQIVPENRRRLSNAIGNLEEPYLNQKK